MYIFLLVIHVIVAVLLVVVILIQRGRGGGLVESFSGVESMFGTRTNQFLTRATTVLAVLFLFTSISLAFLAARRSRSLINEKTISPQAQRGAGESDMPVSAANPGAAGAQQGSIQEQAIPEKSKN